MDQATPLESYVHSMREDPYYEIVYQDALQFLVDEEYRALPGQAWSVDAQKLVVATAEAFTVPTSMLEDFAALLSISTAYAIRVQKKLPSLPFPDARAEQWARIGQGRVLHLFDNPRAVARLIQSGSFPLKARCARAGVAVIELDGPVRKCVDCQRKQVALSSSK